MTVTARDQIDLPMIQAALKRGLVALLLAALTAGLACFAVLSLQPARYTAQTEIEIVARRDRGPAASDAMAAHVRALRSADLARTMAATFKLAQLPQFDSATPTGGTLDRVLRVMGWRGPRAGESLDDRVLKSYGRALSVHQVGSTRRIAIAFTAHNPALAADMANRLAALYRESLGAGEAPDDTRAKLAPQIGSLAAQVQVAEAAALRMREEIARPAGARQPGSSDAQQLADLEAQLAQAEAARRDAQARAQAAHDLVRRGSIATSADAQRTARIASLTEQRRTIERQMSDLSATLLPGHPRMRQLAAERDSLGAQIEAETAAVVAGPDSEARAAADREQDLRRRIDDLKRASAGANEARLQALETLAAAKRAELERLQKQSDAAVAAAEAKAKRDAVEIVTRASAPAEPDARGAGMVTLLAMAVVLLAGFFAIVAHALLTGVRMKPARKAPTREALAAAAARAAAAASGARADPGRAVASIQDLARAIQSDGIGRTGMRTLLTGVLSGLSPDDEAVELAGRLARGGASVMMLAWDVGRHEDAPVLAAWAPPGPGLAELLTGEASFEDVVRRLPDSPAHIISAGAIAGIQAKTLNADRVSLVLDALDDVYDHILIVCRRAGARMLVDLVQGRVDVAVEIATGGEEAMQGEGLAGAFADRIDVLRLRRASRPVAAKPRRSRPTHEPLAASA